MKKIGLVAGREFLAAVTNKGFVFGLLLMPLIIAFMFVVFPRLMNARAPQVSGQIAVVDPTGQVVSELRSTLSADAIAARRADSTRRALVSAPAAAQAGGSAQAIERALGDPPQLEIVERPASASLQDEKAWLSPTSASTSPSPRRLALVVVHQDAIAREGGRDDYGTYSLFVPPNLDERIEAVVYDGVREALVNLRIRARSLDRAEVDAITRVVRPASVTIASGNERQTAVGFNRALPIVLAGLLIFAVMLAGQTLLTSTIEEKSSRVIEVLLSAVSPFELMAGKILGQMAVSLLVLALYLGTGMLALWSSAMIGLLDPSLVLYLFLFFFITYLVFGSVFGAVGAAVNEMREAQALMTPVILLLMAPWLLAAPIAREPNSTLSIAMSFIPPVNTFAMMTRMASSTPPPLWQVWTTVAIGLGTAAATIWCAAKIFKVGLLMHGTPPSFGTLVRWVREA
jgi:ABC-type Na+ efflux pump permease subunit